MKRANASVTTLAVAACALAAAGAAVRGQEGSAAPKPAAPAQKPANLENGRTIYVKYGCWQCHGYEAQGGAGPKLGPDAIPFENFTRITREPPNQMPPYTPKVVTDQELADIYAFVKSVAKPVDPKTIPILRIE
jgi:mono/diheme cytochrome c family protein